MDAITLLKDDHKTLEQLFKRFEKAGPNARVEKRRLVDRMIEELSRHASIEELVFYPAARATVAETDDITLESLEEHHVVKLLLAELNGMDPEHERFDAKVTVLIENVRHHVAEEETEFFPKVRDALSRSDLAEMGETLAAAKATAPTKPRPAAPDEGAAAMVVGTIAGVVDRVSSNVSGFAQGSVNATQDLIARILGRRRPKVSPTGSSATRQKADQVRDTVSTATDGVVDVAEAVTAGATKTARTARKSAGKVGDTASSARKETVRAAQS